MSYPNTAASRPAPFGLDQIPDYTQLREYAHRERSRAVSRALAAIWTWMKRPASLGRQEAGFWRA